MYRLIDEIAKESGLIKIDKHTYHCKGDEKDLACLGIFVLQHWLNMIGLLLMSKNGNG